LAAHFKKPLFLYSPSAGPFENKLLNPVRRTMYRKFDVLATREEKTRLSSRSSNRWTGVNILVKAGASWSGSISSRSP
jgi:hypothetical protein